MKEIIARNISYHYGDKKVLTDFSFEVHEGDFVLLEGDNGTGKTTLLSLLARLKKPSSGTIENNFEKIGYLSQLDAREKHPIPFSVYEILSMSLPGFNFFFKKKNTAIEAVLSAFELNECEKKRLSELSGGQQEKVRLAATLLKNPDLLLLDEPTSGMDEKSRIKSEQILMDLHREGKTIILVSHIPGNLPKDHVILLNRGENDD